MTTLTTLSKQNNNALDPAALAIQIRQWGLELGFQGVGISDVNLEDAEPRLLEWLHAGFHGSMDYMAKHGVKRARPAELIPGTVRVIAARMNYMSDVPAASWPLIADGERAYISRYALGRDYHKVLRARLQRLALRIESVAGVHGHRVFTDSAPVMEVEIARKAGLGWRGKHTLLLTRQAGSMFFLGEIFTNLPLPVDVAQSEHCGSCTKCITVCPTQAILAPYQLDARRCISYLTIEHAGSIPVELRPLIGNRVYGCDDCQLICPWNKYAQTTSEPDFAVRHGLDDVTLVELFAWSEDDFHARLQGSAIHRIGYERWLRNIAVGLGNLPPGSSGASAALAALEGRAAHVSPLVREHVAWALQRLRGGARQAAVTR
ncbi:MAG: tRNA epoxyqueuosine(34) reductase QueG [Betaproteobacteria bacterium]